MQKSNWQVAYENWIGETEGSIKSQEIKKLDSELDKRLQELLHGEAFDEIYNKTAELEALNQETGFKAGFRIGMLACLEVIVGVLEETDANTISITHDEIAELLLNVQEMGSRKVELMIGSFFFDKVKPGGMIDVK